MSNIFISATFPFCKEEVFVAAVIKILTKRNDFNLSVTLVDEQDSVQTVDRYMPLVIGKHITLVAPYSLTIGEKELYLGRYDLYFDLARELNTCFLQMTQNDDYIWGYDMGDSSGEYIAHNFTSDLENFPEVEEDECLGEVDKVASVFDVEKSLIAKYHVHLKKSNITKKAYPLDCFRYGDMDQSYDFVKRIGGGDLNSQFKKYIRLEPL